MAEQLPSIQFEDVPLDEARRMGRGPRMEPMLYETLRQKIQSLSTDATRIHLGPEITPTRMKTFSRRSPATSTSPSPSAVCPAACSSGAPLTRISSKPKRSGPGCRPRGSHRHRLAPTGVGRGEPAKSKATQAIEKPAEFPLRIGTECLAGPDRDELETRIGS